MAEGSRSNPDRPENRDRDVRPPKTFDGPASHPPAFAADRPRPDRHGQPDLTRVEMKRYVLVFDDDRPPKEHHFTALSHDHAALLMKNQFRGEAWRLYCVDSGERQEVGRFPEPAQIAEAPATDSFGMTRA